MKRLIKNEKGYTLILTVGIIVIFTVLGLSLLMLTSSGIKNNENRQNTVQAQDLSDKGIKYAVNNLQHFLENEIQNNPMGKTQFYNLLQENIKVNCPDGIEIPGEKASKTKVCIDHVEMISNEEKDRYKRLVTFKSTGLVNGKARTTTSKVIIGTDAIPDQLHYALSTNNSGDLYLYGGVEIQGNIKTDGNLIITKNAHRETFFDLAKIWEESVGPRLIKDTKSVAPKIFMRKNEKYIYTIDSSKNYLSKGKGDDLKYYLDHLPYKKFSPSDSNTEEILKNKLFSTPKLEIVTKSFPKDQIDISAKIQEQNKNTVDHYYKDLTIPTISFTEPLNPIKNFTNNDTVLVKGDMNILFTKTNFNGTYYVDGDLTIKHTLLKSNALIFVNGNVTIEFSKLKELDSDPNSTLMIFANGNIDISNISNLSEFDDPSEIKGYFYSNQNITLEDISSKLHLTGGISCKEMILSAIRGKAFLNNPVLWSDQSSLDENGQPNVPSRLTVTYDENLAEQYASFLQNKEENITQLNDPEYIERSN